MTSQPIVVTGITTGIPPKPKEIQFPVRLQWSKFAKSRDNVTLYVKALEAMMAMPESITDPESFYQMGGFIVKRNSL